MSQGKATRQSSIVSPVPCSSSTSELCRICCHGISKKEKSILCDYCDTWCHQACTKLDDITFSSLAKSKQKFFCTFCMPIVENFLRNDKRMDEMDKRMDVFEDRLLKLENATPRPPALMDLPTARSTTVKPDLDVVVKLHDKLERANKRKNSLV